MGYCRTRSAELNLSIYLIVEDWCVASSGAGEESGIPEKDGARDGGGLPSADKTVPESVAEVHRKL